MKYFCLTVFLKGIFEMLGRGREATLDIYGGDIIAATIGRTPPSFLKEALQTVGSATDTIKRRTANVIHPISLLKLEHKIRAMAEREGHAHEDLYHLDLLVLEWLLASEIISGEGYTLVLAAMREKYAAYRSKWGEEPCVKEKFHTAEVEVTKHGF